ncbi:MAG: D-TA family PLP-dependent enzyme [Verrucomicrobiota bacterium]|nr:D-TA family PLP-dependent enzyme [Verrucomicrobiota bacterium]
MAPNPWFVLENAAEIPSPTLVLHRGRIEANLRRMVAIAGDPLRLWPHVKTHKLPELIAWQVGLGIVQFKCATIAEAEMVAEVEGVRSILLAVQPVGPQIERWIRLASRFPDLQWSAVVDDASVVESLRSAAAACPISKPLGIWIDLDIGQHRTGIAPDLVLGSELLRPLRASEPALRLDGLHAYDGHLGITDLTERTRTCDEAFAPVAALRSRIETELGRPLGVIAGGSPTFAIHAARANVSLSPGTTVLWDAGYAQKLPDLPFEPAAVLLSRVISRPAARQVCLDLGHKAVAAEMPHPRTVFLNLPDATALSHSEEHLVVESPAADALRLGDVIYSLPWHVCPTVALHQEVWLAENGRATRAWTVQARSRRISI